MVLCPARTAGSRMQQVSDSPFAFPDRIGQGDNRPLTNCQARCGSRSGPGCCPCWPIAPSSSRCWSTSPSTRATRCPTAARWPSPWPVSPRACASPWSTMGPGWPRRCATRLRALLHDEGPGPGHGPGAGDRARHRHRLGRHGGHRVRAGEGHQRHDLPARLPRGGPPYGAAGRARRARSQRRQGARGRGPGAGTPPGLPDPRGSRLRGDRGGRRRGGSRRVGGGRRPRHRRGHAGHDGPATRAGRRERNPDLRVVYMSGHTEDVLVRSGARARNLAFVQKPFTRATLLRAVEDALAAAPGWPSSRPSGSRPTP